jgi:hypothetical protein
MTTRKIFVFAAVSLLIGFLVGYLFRNFQITGLIIGTTKENVADQVKKLYALANPLASIEVVTSSEESGMYKVVLRARDVNGLTYREVYATKDGKLLTENLIFVEKYIQQIESLKNFVDCLDNESVRVYGINNQTATLLQLNVLGIYSGKLYVSCDGQLVTRCIDAGVQEVPSVAVGKDVFPGVKTLDWFEQQTKCRLT